MACCCELQNTLDVEVTQDVLDVEIDGSAGVLLQAKSVEITENGTSVVAPDYGFDGMQFVEINTNTPKNITGVIGAPDGVSLVHLLGEPESVTTLVDDNIGWDNTTENMIDTLKILFPNVADITLRCKTSVKLIKNPALSINQPSLPELETTGGMQYTFINGLEEWYLPKIKAFTKGSDALDDQLANLKKMNFPELESIGEGDVYPNFFYQRSFPNLEEMYFPNLKRIKTWGTARTLDVAGETPKFRRLVLGKLEYLNAWRGGAKRVDLVQQADLNLIDIEIGKGTAISFSLESWNPNNVLSDVDKTATFLQNFRDHIAERLTGKGTGLKLTLSQEVRNAIHAAEDEYGIENIIITQKGWTISPAPN